MEPYHHFSVDKALQRLESSHNGLNEKQVKEKRIQFAWNELPVERKISLGFSVNVFGQCKHLGHDHRDTLFSAYIQFCLHEFNGIFGIDGTFIYRTLDGSLYEIYWSKPVQAIIPDKSS